MLNSTKSVASNSSTSSTFTPIDLPTRERTKKSTIIISSDEEDELEGDDSDEPNDVVQITETYVP